MIDVNGLSFALRARTILRDVTFKVDRGERVAILGPNGAGKTTLLKCLVRILRATSGRIVVGGRRLEDTPQNELARHLAYVPQGNDFAESFTVREFVEMARYPHLGPLAPARPHDREQIERAMEETGTAALSDRTMGTLSGGERQKAFLAAALAQEAGVLLLDEPTTYLDPHHQADVFRTLARAHEERGIAILLVTHDVNHALARADRAIALREGGIVFDGPVGALAGGGTLKSIYAHDFAVASHPRTGRVVVFPE